MKISRLFHWLYAILMLLPIVSVIGVGLYYAFNKNAVIPQVEENIEKEVDFNQNIDFINSSVDYEYTLSGSYTFQHISITPINEDHTYYFKFSTDTIFDDDLLVYASSFLIGYNNIHINNYTGYGNEFLAVSGNDTLYIVVNCYNGYIINDDIHIKLNVYDLTQMFGVGNEPSIQDFNDIFTDYYDYIISKHIVVVTGSEQVADNLVNHFWLPSFGGMGWTLENVMRYLVGNMFGLVVSSGIGFIVVRLLTYWLCVSLIWLVFDVIMYVPLLIHRYLDKGVLD